MPSRLLANGVEITIATSSRYWFRFIASRILCSVGLRHILGRLKRIECICSSLRGSNRSPNMSRMRGERSLCKGIDLPVCGQYRRRFVSRSNLARLSATGNRFQLGRDLGRYTCSTYCLHLQHIFQAYVCACCGPICKFKRREGVHYYC